MDETDWISLTNLHAIVFNMCTFRLSFTIPGFVCVRFLHFDYYILVWPIHRLTFAKSSRLGPFLKLTLWSKKLCFFFAKFCVSKYGSLTHFFWLQNHHVREILSLKINSFFIINLCMSKYHASPDTYWIIKLRDISKNNDYKTIYAQNECENIGPTLLRGRPKYRTSIRYYIVNWALIFEPTRKTKITK